LEAPVWYGDNPGLIAQRMRDICTRLLVIEEAEREYQWLAAQDDADLLNPASGGQLDGGFTQAQLDRARATFADLHALWLLVHDQAAPASYGITGTYDFLNNARHVIAGQ
jgi:hypothetical protein